MEARKAAEHEFEVRAAFEQLDTDSDNSVTVAEIQQRLELDDDGDGEVRERKRERGSDCVPCPTGLTGGGHGLLEQPRVSGFPCLPGECVVVCVRQDHI